MVAGAEYDLVDILQYRSVFEGDGAWYGVLLDVGG